MLNLLYSGNDNVFDGLLISILSIIKHNKCQVNVFALTMDLTDIDEKFKKISEKKAQIIDAKLKEVNPDSFFKLIDCTKLFLETGLINSINFVNFYTPYAMLRLLSDKVDCLPEKIIYLDTDTMIRGNLEELQEIDVNDYEYAGVRDYLGKIFRHPMYINSGVLLMNLKEIKKTGLFEKCRKKVIEVKMPFPDQDAIFRCTTKKKFIKRKFNSQRRIYDDTIVRHFCKSIRWLPFFHTINIKPWEVDKMRNIYKIHEFDDILNEYQAIKEKVK